MWSLSLKPLSGPAKEPLDLELEVKPHCRLDPGMAPQEDLLKAAIETARHNCETFTGRQLITATWILSLGSWWEEGIFREGALFLPRPPVQSISSIKYIDTAGQEQTWATTNWDKDLPTGPIAQKARVWVAYGESFPALRCMPGAVGAVKIEYIAGYGLEPANVPAPLRQGMLLEVGEMDKRRELVTAGIVTPVMLTAEALWWPFRAF